MEIANASLLDEATAAAEAMTMLHRVQAKRIEQAAGPAQFFVADSCFPQTIDVLRARAEPLGIELVVGDGAVCRIQPARCSARSCRRRTKPARARLLGDFIARAQEAGVLVAVATDLLAPDAADAARRDGRRRRRRQLAAIRRADGVRRTARRVLRDASSSTCARCPAASSASRSTRTATPAYRMALQTREQHIRREKATSNICTAQALLANMAGFYAVYHGPTGLTAIARRVHAPGDALWPESWPRLGVRQLNAAVLRHAAARGARRHVGGRSRPRRRARRPA